MSDDQKNSLADEAWEAQGERDDDPEALLDMDDGLDEEWVSDDDPADEMIEDPEEETVEPDTQEQDSPPLASSASMASSYSSDSAGDARDFEKAVKRAMTGLPEETQLEVLKLMQGATYKEEIWGPIAAIAVISARMSREGYKAKALDERAKSLEKKIEDLQETIREIPKTMEEGVQMLDNKIQKDMDRKLRAILNSFGKHAENRFKEEQDTLRGLIEGAWDRSVNEIASQNSVKLFRVFSRPILAMLAIPLGAGILVGVLLALGLSA